MYFAGTDIGSRNAKFCVLKDDEIMSLEIIDTGADSPKTARIGLTKCLEGSNLTIEDMDYIVSTGYGRVLVPFANKNISEISCHAKGANYFTPAVRTIIDMGGQDCKAINCDENGKVTDYVMNDKCAGGTGRFLEIIGEVLGLPIDEIGPMALKSMTRVEFSTICAVFAKSDAIRMKKQGVKSSDILAGLNDAISVRVQKLLNRISEIPEFTITGGIAKNVGMVKKISEKIGATPLLAPDPQIVGAVGAALFAKERYKKLKKSA